MSITSLRGSTLPNKSFRAGRAKTRDVVTIAPDTATTFANGASISAGGGGSSVTISNVSVTDSGYILSNTTPYIDSTGGYIKITGTGFAAGCTVYVSGTPATSTTFISSTEVRAQVGAAASNAQSVYIVNTDSSVAILLNAITYSGTPSWSTGATLSSQVADIAFSIPLSATSDSSIVYSLASGSSTPSGTILFSNGVFAGTITGITNDTNYSFTVVATDIENQLSARAFTVSVASGDTYFNTTTLLLNGDANVWIRDSSTNNFLPTTIAGDTKPTAFSPYNTSWSAYFDGNGDYISSASSGTLTPGSTFTIECWIYPTSTSGLAITDNRPPSTNGNYFQWGVTAGAVSVYVNSTTIGSTGAFVTTNTWSHLAYVRTGGVGRIYINGLQRASFNDATTYLETVFNIGYASFASGWFLGYISNFRYVNGTAVFTGNFTPQTTTLGNTQSAGSNIAAITSGSTFLTLQDNRFRDNGTNSFAITRSGDTAIRSFGPFTETDTTTGSAYFDGSGDYLYFPSNSVYTLGTNDHCIEFWMYPNGAQSQYSVPWYYNGSIVYYFSVGSDSNQAFLLVGGGSPWSLAITILNAEYVRILNNWVHVAITRSGTAFRVFFNGRLVGYGTTAQSISAQTSAFSIGWDGTNATTYYKGWITDFRLINGSIPAAYQTSSTTLGTTIFTPPTSSLSRVANTQLLTLQYRTGENNHRFVDEAGIKHPLTRAGQVSQGSFSPFSPAGWSAYFDGTGDYLTVPASSDFDFGTGDYTIEGWIYSSSTTWTLYATGGSGSQDQFSCDAGTLYWNYTALGAGVPNFFVTSDLNTWTHVAASRTSGNTRIFKNGGLKGSTSTVASIGSSVNTLQIGRRSDGFYLTTGYMSNIRVVKGTSQYTANFTPATTALTAVADTKLLILQNNRFIDANTTPKTITTVGDVRIQAFSPFRPSGSYNPILHGGSAFFDGSGDYITTVSTTSTILPTSTTNTFTIDGWLYPTALGALAWIFGDMEATGGSNNVAVDISSSNKIELYWYAGGAGSRAISADSVVLNQWNYFAIVVNNNAITIYVNSTTAGQTGTTTLTTRILGTSGWAMGAWNSASYYTGYMSGMRWTNGVARTISSIPTAPPSLDANTSVLMNFTQGGVVDASARNVMETAGTVRVSNVVSKFGIGSINFGTRTDYLAIPSTPRIAILGGDFTLEAWVYPTDISLSQCWGIIDARQSAGSANAWIWRLDSYSSGWVSNFYTGTNYFSTGRVQANVWTHLAVVRSGTTLTFYINGSASGTATVSGVITGTATTNPIYIGTKDTGSGSTYGTVGYIDDLRITNGSARTITLPTQTFLTK